jgi:hypothetical protein
VTKLRCDSFESERKPVKIDRCLALVVLLPLATAAGCGPSVGTVPVRGTVLVDGEPVSGVTVQFSPVTGERPSTGFTDDSGQFVLRYNKDIAGVLPGRQNVTFSWYAEEPDQKPTPGQAALIATHGDQRGKPYEVEISGPAESLVIEVVGKNK